MRKDLKAKKGEIMGKNNNYYRQCREELSPKPSREAAAERIGNGMTEDILEKIETGIRNPRPEEILDMAKAYNHPELCNYYCTHECAIGKTSVPPIDGKKNIATITLEILSSMNYLEETKNRLVDITQDEDLTPDEYEDMKQIRDRLKKMAGSIANLQLWVDQKLGSE